MAEVPSTSAVKRTVLFERHVALGAKIVPFGGWDMPLAYGTGTIAEHRACRTSCVVFDVSHLGTVRVSGPGAFEALQRAFTNDLAKIEPGRAQYTHLLDPSDASVLDDIIVWWRSAEVFDVMPNASNTERVRAALKADDVTVVDVTADRAVIAVQGPTARSILESVSAEAASIGRFRVGTFRFGGVECVVAGTGYTGEDGVECAVPTAAAGEFWDAVVAAGALPAGLGARDTLRLEAGLPLHGHELGPGITSLQAGLGWAVSWTKGPFAGRDALAAERDAGVKRRLVGISIPGRQPARDGSTVFIAGTERELGTVSSGNFSPTLDHAIALAFLRTDAGDAVAEGSTLELDVRGRRIPGVIVKPPFVPKH